VIEHTDPRARALLAFRDALRADPGLRREYAALKQQLAAVRRGNRNAYSNAKSDFVQRVLRSAGLQAPVRDPLPEWLPARPITKDLDDFSAISTDKSSRSFGGARRGRPGPR